MPVSPDERPPTPPASKPELVELNRSRMTLRSRSRTEEIRSPVESAQRTAVKQRPHQETRWSQVAMSEPVVLHHGREGGGAGHDAARPSASTACWAALITGSA